MWIDLDKIFEFANTTRLLFGSMVLAKAVGMTMRGAMVVDMGGATGGSMVQFKGVGGVLREGK